MISLQTVLVVSLIHSIIALPSQYSRWKFRSVVDSRKPQDPFKNAKLSLSPMHAVPFRGETGFPPAQTNKLNLNIPTIAPASSKTKVKVSLQNIIRKFPAPQMRRNKARVVRSNKMPEGIINKQSRQQNLRFEDPTSGKSFQFTVPATVTAVPTYPMPTQVYDLEDARTFPSTYEKKEQLPFDKPHENSYANDDAFFKKLDVLREDKLSNLLKRKEKSPFKYTRDSFWKHLLFYLANA